MIAIAKAHVEKGNLSAQFVSVLLTEGFEEDVSVVGMMNQREQELASLLSSMKILRAGSSSKASLVHEVEEVVREAVARSSDEAALGLALAGEFSNRRLQQLILSKIQVPASEIEEEEEELAPSFCDIRSSENLCGEAWQWSAKDHTSFALKVVL